MGVEDVLVFRENEVRQGVLNQRLSFHPEQFGGGEVGFQDHPLLVQGHVADRGQVIEVEVAFPRGFQFRLRPAQFLILHLQLDLVNPQFMEHLLHLLGRQVVLRPCNTRPQTSLSPLAQVVRRTRTGFIFIHILPPVSTVGLSTAATSSDPASDLA